MPLHIYTGRRLNATAIRASGKEVQPSPEAMAARNSFEAYREFVCNHTTPEHHQRWMPVLNTGKNSQCLTEIGGDHTLILAPRGSAKSTFLLEWVSYQIGKHTGPGIRLPIKILYVSYSVDIAMAKSAQIQNILDSPRFREVFPWCRPGVPWGMRNWDINKAWAKLSLTAEPYTMVCAGMKGSVASRRAHLCIFDDLIKSPEQIDNPGIREKMIQNWNQVIKPVMFEGARAICLGTRMRVDDIYDSTFNEANGWNVIEESALIDDEETGEEVSYWPSQWSREYLAGLRADDPVSFSFQYQNKVLRVEDISIDPEWVVEESMPAIDTMDSLCISCDLSASLKEKADYTVFILAGKRGDEYFILDARRGRWSGNIDKINVLLRLALDWGILETDEEYDVEHRTGRVTFKSASPVIRQGPYYANFYPEAKSYQISLLGDWNSYVKNTLNIWNITCLPLDLKGDKLQKLRGISGILQRRQVKFNKYKKSMKRVKDELVNFGSIGHDDCVDAVVLALAGLGARVNLASA